MLALLVALSHAKMASEKRACPPTQATCVGARGAGDHESNELSRKQLWLHPRYCCLGVRSVRPKGGRERESVQEGEMGRTTTEGRINSAAIWSTESREREEEGQQNLASLSPSP